MTAPDGRRRRDMSRRRLVGQLPSPVKMPGRAPLARSQRRQQHAAEAVAWRQKEPDVPVARIAEKYGVTPSTVYDWLSDVDATRAAARKQRYRGKRCASCGAPTSAAADAAQPARCPACSYGQRRRWTRERIIEELRAARDAFGRIPTASDFHRDRVSRRGPQAVERFERVGLSQSQVTRRFGSWKAAIDAAFGEDDDRR